MEEYWLFIFYNVIKYLEQTFEQKTNGFYLNEINDDGSNVILLSKSISDEMFLLSSSKFTDTKEINNYLDNKNSGR